MEQLPNLFSDRILQVHIDGNGLVVTVMEQNEVDHIFEGKVLDPIETFGGSLMDTVMTGFAFGKNTDDIRLFSTILGPSDEEVSFFLDKSGRFIRGEEAVVVGFVRQGFVGSAGDITVDLKVVQN